jgi:ParB/RepB/Spo0J family partition protein
MANKPIRAVPRVPGQRVAEDAFQSLVHRVEAEEKIAPFVVGAATALELPIDAIEEDPDQPRKTFDAASLRELAATIQERGVMQPISVRPHATPGRYIINYGARRFRASKLVGLTSIPAVVQSNATAADQVIENLQRDALTPMEIAEFIGIELQKGRKKIDIAAAIGKSPGFVSQHVTLLELPAPLQRIFEAGRCRDVTVINELNTLYGRYPDETRAWLEEPPTDITRGAVAVFREYCLEQARQASEPPTAADGGADHALPSQPQGQRGAAKARVQRVDAQRSQMLSQALGVSVIVDAKQIRIAYGASENLDRIANALVGAVKAPSP